MKINSILSTKGREVITSVPEETLTDAIRRLVLHNIGSLVVTGDEGEIIGILSERDIIRALTVSREALSLPIKNVMSRIVILAEPNDDVMSVANTMTEKRFRHMPIVEKGKLVGIVSIGDILKAQRDQYKGEIETLETQIMADD